ncbi:hypothetical protein [Pseudaestuariivita rosea]|uniref:hypothetical protein n=1 Tax=Pseudaestuariivita rosea TaxID=2763263 RepID=UPI001ABAD3A1|nr:hypothetical protein [Pseudaestuariivita rosea]
MSGLGHNNGPTMEGGYRWRKHVWTKARADLLPKLPIEIVRLRVKRAQELGLEYKTYASVRASTGRDVVGFLFSTNALRLVKGRDRLRPDRNAKLQGLRACQRIAVVQPPLSAAAVMGLNPVIDLATAAPRAFAPWSEVRRGMQGIARQAQTPGDSLLVIGDTALEREWSEAGRLAGYIPADQYFGATP